MTENNENKINPEPDETGTTKDNTSFCKAEAASTTPEATEKKETINKKKRAKNLPPPKEKPKIKNVKYSGKNPFMLILEQHSAHRAKIAKIIVLATCVIALILLLIHRVHKYAEAKALRQEIEKTEANLKKIEQEMDSAQGYSKSKKVFEAFKWIEYIVERDYSNKNKWERRRQSFLDKISDMKPDIGGDYVVPSTGIDMVFIPRGQFFMGSYPKETSSREEELPRRLVTISHDFWIARTETTNMQFNEIFPTSKPDSWNGFRLDLPFQPVVRVDWHRAAKYCEKLTEMERKSGRLPEGYEYRLPTEAEWEYACRAGTDTYYFWGNEFGIKGAQFANSLDKRSAARFAWKSGPDMADWDGYFVSARVSSYKPNAFQLFDMSGNVWEWCYDWYNPRAYKDLPAIDPVQLEPIVSSIEIKTDFDRRYEAECTSKVLRGGSWGNLPADLRSAKRSSSFPEDGRNTGIGFRVVLAPCLSQSLQAQNSMEKKEKQVEDKN